MHTVCRVRQAERVAEAEYRQRGPAYGLGQRDVGRAGELGEQARANSVAKLAKVISVPPPRPRRRAGRSLTTHHALRQEGRGRAPVEHRDRAGPAQLDSADGVGVDAPSQAAAVAAALVVADKRHDHRLGRSSSAAKKADAAFKIALARFNSAFSRRSRFTSADSSVLVPGRAPASTSACRTHFRTVSPLPIPSSCDTWFIAAHSDSC